MRFAPAVFVVVLLVVAVGGVLIFSQGSGTKADVVLYCGVDQDQSQVLVQRFEAESNLSVDYHGEEEAFRGIGLPQRIEAEREAPRADVWWSNEIMHMVDLAERGLIDPLPAGVAELFPAAWRDPAGRFIQFGARGRVLLVNTELLPDPATHPKTIEDLLDPRWEAMGLTTTMAIPLSGTTYTHAVALLVADEKKALDFFDRALAAAEAGRVKLVSSNGQVMQAVADSKRRIAFGLTDTDDAWIAISEKRAPVTVVWPDQGEGQVGTVLIPNTAALVKGRPNPEAAETLLRWLARADTERWLAASRSAQIPVRPLDDLPTGGLVLVPGVDFRAAAIDWRAVGLARERWRDVLAARFQRGG